MGDPVPMGIVCAPELGLWAMGAGWRRQDRHLTFLGSAAPSQPHVSLQMPFLPVSARAQEPCLKAQGSQKSLFST